MDSCGVDAPCVEVEPGGAIQQLHKENLAENVV